MEARGGRAGPRGAGAGRGRRGPGPSPARASGELCLAALAAGAGSLRVAAPSPGRLVVEAVAADVPRDASGPVPGALRLLARGGARGAAMRWRPPRSLESLRASLGEPAGPWEVSLAPGFRARPGCTLEISGLSPEGLGGVACAAVAAAWAAAPGKALEVEGLGLRLAAGWGAAEALLALQAGSPADAERPAAAGAATDFAACSADGAVSVEGAFLRPGQTGALRAAPARIISVNGVPCRAPRLEAAARRLLARQKKALRAPSAAAVGAGRRAPEPPLALRVQCPPEDVDFLLDAEGLGLGGFLREASFAEALGAEDLLEAALRRALLGGASSGGAAAERAAGTTAAPPPEDAGRPSSSSAFLGLRRRRSAGPEEFGPPAKRVLHRLQDAALLPPAVFRPPTEPPILDLQTFLRGAHAAAAVPGAVCRDILREEGPSVRTLEQVDRKFFPAVSGHVLYLCEQHAADERCRLEALQSRLQAHPEEVLVSRPHAQPQQLDLGPAEEAVVLAYRARLEQWGWRLGLGRGAEGGQSGARLLASPEVLGESLTPADLREFAEQLEASSGADALPPSVQRLLNSKACRSAIMFGEALDRGATAGLFRSLVQTALPFHCAHGRPTLVPLVDLSRLGPALSACGLPPPRPLGPAPRSKKPQN